MEPHVVLLPGGVFAAVTIGVYCLVERFGGVRPHVRRRLRELETRRGNVVEHSSRSGVLARLLRRRPPEGNAGPRLDERPPDRLARRLSAAGFDSATAAAAYAGAQATLVVIPLAVAILGALSHAFDMRTALWVSLGGGGIGAILPRCVVDHLARRRQRVIERALPDFCDLVVTCVEGGTSLEAALQRVTDDLRVPHPVLSRELARVQQHVQLGAAPDEGLLLFGNRVDLDSVRTMAALVQQSRRFGTGIGEALRGHADALREQREQRAEEMAQKAAVKIILPTMLCIFPAVFVVLAGPAAIQLAEAFAPGGEANSDPRP